MSGWLRFWASSLAMMVAIGGSACSDGTGSASDAAADAAAPDLSNDALVLDIGTAPDNGQPDVRMELRPDVGEAGRLDATRDAAVDSRVLDATLPDGESRDSGHDGAADDGAVDALDADDVQVPDASADTPLPDADVDADTQDAAGPVPDACVGAPPPPPPPPSVNGEEVCNYLDDDGDGVVDEGFEYDFISEWMPVSQRAYERFNVVNLDIDQGGRAVAWTSTEGVSAVLLDERLCPTHEPITFKEIPFSSTVFVKVAVFHETMATMVEYVRPRSDNIPILQLVSAQGRIGAPIVLTPENEAASSGFNSLSSTTAGFVAFVSSPENNRLLELRSPEFAAEPWRPIGPSTGFASTTRVISDETGYALITSWVEDGRYVSKLQRWDQGWRVTLPPTEIGPGLVDWDARVGRLGESYLFPLVGSGFSNQLWLARVSPNARHLAGSPWLLYEQVNGLPIVLGSFASRNGQQFYSGLVEGVRGQNDVLRESSGLVLQTFSENASRVLAFDLQPESGLVMATAKWVEAGERAAVPEVARYGCVPGEQ